MVSSQPKFNIEFKEQAVLAIQRQARGDVLMILDDSTSDIDCVEYTTLGEVDPSQWTSKNYDEITLAFMGNPSKVIIVKKEETLIDVLQKLAYYTNYTLCYPNAESTDFTAIQNYIKSQRAKNDYSIAIFGNATSPDAEYIINFCTESIQANVNGSVKTYSAGDYTARVAGALSGLSQNRSLTYYELGEISSCTLQSNEDKAVQDGELVIIHQDGTFKFGRAVNSLTTLTDGKTEAFQKIRVVGIMDMIANDIVTTFRTGYVGKFTNNFSNKNRFVGAINSYLLGLASEGLLEEANSNEVAISYNKTKSYLTGKGIDTSKMSYMDIIKANTGSKVLLDGVCSPTDTMEDLDITVFLYQGLENT